jgi:hypothetical protein
MAEYIQLPSGAYLELKKGQTPLQGMMAARQLYPDAFKTEEDKPKQDTTGGTAAAAAGFERLKGEAALTAGKLGLMDEAEAEKYYKAKEAAAKARFTPTEKGWTEDPLLKFRETLGGSVPYMLAPAAAGLAAVAAPVSAPVAAGLGLLGAGAVSTGQFTGSNLAAQMETGKTLEQTSGAAALGAAIPQALIDTAAMALLPGIGKLFGSVGSKLTTAEARAIANQTLGKAAMDYTAKTGKAMTQEGFTETVQQVLERLQAGTSLTDEDARREYIDSFIGGAALSGAIAPAGRYIERSGAKSQAAKADREDRNAAAKLAAEQEALAVEKEIAQRQTPEYALKTVGDMQKLEEEKLALQKQIRKVTKDSTTEAEDKAFNKQINDQLKVNAAARNELAPEVSRLKQSGLYQQAVEQERVSKLTPEEYALEQAKTVSNKPAKYAEPDLEGYYEQQVYNPNEERRKAEAAEQERVAAVPATYAAERMELARSQRYDPTGQDYIEYLLQDPYKAGLVVANETDLPGLTASESRLIRNAVAKRLKAMGKEELAARQTELQGQNIGAEPANPMAAFMEQSDTLDVDRRQGLTDADIAFVENQAAMPTGTTTQGELFGGAPQLVNMPLTGTRADIDAQIAELEKQLDVAKSYGAPDAISRRANRERISSLLEQIEDLKDRQAIIASGAPRGEVSTTALGEAFGIAQPEQEKAAQARRDALDKFTNTDYMARNGFGQTEADVEAAKQGVVDALLKEISNVRGKLKPETITAIERDIRQLLDNKMMFGQDYGPTLDELSARWRAGVRRDKYGPATPTPTQTTAGMLHAQMSTAFAQRERYSPEVMALLERIGDNFKAFIGSPDRLNMAGEWLNRLTTTGQSSPEMTRDLQAALDALDRAKISETETPTRETAFGTAIKPTQTAVQGELGAEFMPEAVAPQSETRVVNGKVQYVAPEDKGPLQGSAAERYAPMQKGTIFNTPEELDQYLASDYLKEARENEGLARATVQRMAKQVTEYETKIADTQKQIDALQERKAELAKLQTSERRVADQLVADTEVQLQELLQQLADNLGPIRMSLEQAEVNLAAAEARSEETSRLIANNIANFTAMDDKVVRAAQATVEAKAELRKARNKLGSLEEKRPAIEAAQRKVIDALQRQRNPVLYEMQEELQELQKKLSKARVVQPQTVERLKKEIAELEDRMDVQRDNPYVPSSAMITFLNNDLQLHMDAMQDRQKIGAAKRSVGHFKTKLEKAAADLDVNISTHPEVKALKEQISVGKELGTDALRGVEGEMALIDDEIEKLQNQQNLAESRAGQIEDQIIEASESRSFAAQLAGGTPDTTSAIDRAEALAKDKKKLEEFQGRTERLSKIPGQRIDFSKRQEMLELVNASTEDFAALDAAIEEMQEGVEELQVRDHFMHEEMLDLQDQAKSFRGPRKNSKAGKEHFAKMEAHKQKMEENNQRIQSLRASITQYEKTRATKQAALAKAEQATSSDPEIYQEVTKAIDQRMAKLEKTISGKETAIVKADEAILKMARDIKAKADEGKTAPEKLAKMRDRLKVLKASQADRRKHLKEYIKEREVLQARRSNRLGITRTNVLTGETVAGGRGKKPGLVEQEQFDAEIERAQQLGKEKDRLETMEAQLAAMKKAKPPRGKAKQAEREEKIRELQEKVNKQKEEVDRLTPQAQGRVSQATRVESSAPGKLRAGTAESKAEPDIARRPVTESRTFAQPTAKQAVADAAEFVERLTAAKTPAALTAEFESKNKQAREDILTAVDSNVAMYRSQVATLKSERNALQAFVDVAEDPTTVPLVTRSRLAKVRTELEAKQRSLTLAEIAKAEAEKMAYPSLRTTAEETKFEFSRGTPVNGGQTVASLEKALDKAVGDPGVAGKRIKIFQSVSDLFADPQYGSDYKGADIPANAKAFVNPKNGQAVMFADNIGKGEELGVLLHEIGVHIGFRNLFSAAQYKQLVNAVKGWAKRNDNSSESKIAKRAIERVEAAETTAEQYDDELLAYAVEEAIKAGVNPDALQNGSPIRSWLKVVMDVLKKALAKYGINVKTLTAGDLVNMAYGAAQLELRGTWHGSDAVFTEFDSKFSGAGEGSYENRFEGSTNLGRGPYTTPNKEYAEYYQFAVPFGKAANETGYGDKSYQDYRANDDKYLSADRPYVTPVVDLQNIYESNLLTHYLQDVAKGGELDPQKNKGAARYLEQLLRNTESGVAEQERMLANQEKKSGKEARIESARNEVKLAQNKFKAARTLDIAKIKGLKERPKVGQLYRSLDDIPRKNVYEVNSLMTIGERPKIDALLKQYGNELMYEDDKHFYANMLFFKMQDTLGIDKTVKALKDAGIDAIEQPNDEKYIERAYIDQAPEILGMNLNPVGPAAGKGRPGTGTLLFSRGAPADALEELALKTIAQPKSLKERLGSNLALQAEMQAVDMRAGLRDTLKFGDDKLFTQAMYHVRKAEQKMAQMFTVMNSGPLESYTDSKGLVGYRSSNKNSAREVFDAIADIPKDSPQMKVDVAQMYMVAQRAQNKGLSKLDLGELDIKEEDLKAALAAADADPALKDALENVRRKYNAYNKGLIEFLASTGRITKKAAADLLKDGDYVPFYRVSENGMAELNFGNNVTFNVGDIRRQPYLAELKGGETKLLPLNEAIQQNTLLLTDMALTNNAAKSVAYGLQALGKGMGPVDPITGKRKNLMPIKTGPGPADARTIRFYQEPDPNNKDDTGERHIVVDTKGTLAEGIPAELVVQSLEGSSLALPGFLKLGGVAADLLRSGVTRTPLYIARKLLREPMAASFTGGLESNVFSSVFKAGAEYVRMSKGSSDAQAKLIEKGLIQSNIFAGDMSDMKKMALQLASGKDQGTLEKVLAAADRYAMRADAATLALVLKNAEAQGLSEVEADMATMESMNFYKRGLSPTLQYASRLIPFFNAQIQGLNVLIKAARGNMPFEEQQEIKRKFFNNALLLTATGLIYAMAMEDDETFRNAKPRDKYSNFFLPIPGVDEPLKLPIPFEAGYFYSLAVAAVDAMRAETDGKAQWSALKDMFLGSIPGYSSMGMPQIVKPAFEVWTNKNFLTGGPIETMRMENLSTEARYLATTTELAKQMSKALPILSPVQIEHIVRGYLGVLPLAAAAAANSLFEGESKGVRPEGRASDLPLLGSAFQKKYGGADAEVVFRDAKEAEQIRNTFNDMLKTGRRAEAAEYREEHKAELALAPLAGQYRQIVGRINEDIRRTQERTDLNAQEKRARLDMLDKAKQERADAFIKAQRKIEERYL